MKLRSPSRAGVTLSAGLILLVATTIFAQRLAAPQSKEASTARDVCEMIRSQHISRTDLNDDIAKRLLTRYLQDLDPQKLYFTAKDIERFQGTASSLDDQLRDGNIEAAHRIFEVYLARLDERIEFAHKLIDNEHDFTVDEDMLIDADKLQWSVTSKEWGERWRQRIKFDLLNLKLDDTSVDEARDQLHKRYRTVLNTMRQTEPSEILEMYLSALCHCFDPHSSFMSAETLEDFQIDMRKSLEGIGAALRSEYGHTIVAQIVPGGAADKDGQLKVGDKIVAVGQGEDGEFEDIVEMKLSRVVRLIRGPRGTTVRLKVKTEASGEIKEYRLARQKIELKSSEVKGVILDAGERLSNQKGRIGVINIPSFYRDFDGARRRIKDYKSTSRDVARVLEEFRAAGGVDAVIVDLRTNGGGALTEAIEVSGLFIDEGTVVQVKEQDGRVTTHDDVIRGTHYDGPLVVLCNRLSASASEIFAGVIKDYGRGVVVGDTTTHGKGTVQNVMPVGRQILLFNRNRGALKLTINQFYRVNGDSTQERGVPSDIVLPSILDHMDVGEEFLDNALAFNQVPAADHESMGMLTPELVGRLRKASARRVSGNDEFAKVKERIDRYLARKNRKSISLNESVRRSELEEANEEKESQEEETDNADKPIFPEGFYNDEVLQITVDYAREVKQLATAQK